MRYVKTPGPNGGAFALTFILDSMLARTLGF